MGSMNGDTVFRYKNAIGEIVFSKQSRYWVTDISGVSGVAVNISDEQSLGQVGSTITARSVQPRPITINGCIFEPLEQTRANLIDVISPGVPSELSVTENGETWFLNVDPKSALEISVGDGVQNFQVQLYCAYPHWRTMAQHVEQLTGLQALFKFPFYTGGSWYISQFTVSFFKEIINTGNASIGFRATFTARAALSDPEIYLMETGQRIKFNVDMESGDQIHLETYDGDLSALYTHNSGEQENGYWYMAKESDMGMQLRPGVNTFRSSAGTGRENLSVRLEAYQGVKTGA